MSKIRVLILCKGIPVDSIEFDDPRARFVREFNELNFRTPFEAVIAEASGIDDEDGQPNCMQGDTHAKPSPMNRPCQPPIRRCGAL